MERITAAMVVALAAVVFTGMVPGKAFAEAPQLDLARASAPVSPDTTPRGSRVLALLLTLEALRTAPGSPTTR